jgi:hypothetical protein
MNESFTLPTWARNVLTCVGLFLLGGLISFGYSYRPLHGAMAWKVDQLEERIDARNLENLRLTDEIAQLRASESTRIDPESLADLEGQFSKARIALEQAEKDLKRADRKRKDANSSASRWRKRYETLRDESAQAKAVMPVAAPDPAPAQRAEPAATAPGPAAAATAPTVSPAPSPSAPETGILPENPAAQTAP